MYKSRQNIKNIAKIPGILTGYNNLLQIALFVRPLTVSRHVG